MRSGAKQSICPLVCLQERQLRQKEDRHIHEYWIRVIWSSMGRLRKPSAHEHMHSRQRQRHVLNAARNTELTHLDLSSNLKRPLSSLARVCVRVRVFTHVYALSGVYLCYSEQFCASFLFRHDNHWEVFTHSCFMQIPQGLQILACHLRSSKNRLKQETCQTLNQTQARNPSLSETHRPTKDTQVTYQGLGTISVYMRVNLPKTMICMKTFVGKVCQMPGC